MSDGQWVYLVVNISIILGLVLYIALRMRLG